MEKHPSFGYVTPQEMAALENAASPWHRKELKKKYKKLSKERAKIKKKPVEQKEMDV